MRKLDNVTAVIGHVGRMALNILLPPRCLICGETVETIGALCAPCWRGIVFLAEPCCALCGLPFPHDAGDGALCAACIAHRPSFDHARSVVSYDDHSRKLVLSLKHGDRLHGVPAFGQWLARVGADYLRAADLIVPVPLHWTRLWHRRFNQSALLAKATRTALRARGEPCPDFAPTLLIRRKRTPSQGHRTRTQRAENVRAAFALHKANSVTGKHIVLIDDVLTSGATAEECARVLKRAGAAQVDVLTLARAVRTQ